MTYDPFRATPQPEPREEIFAWACVKDVRTFTGSLRAVDDDLSAHRYPYPSPPRVSSLVKAICLWRASSELIRSVDAANLPCPRERGAV
jgi:hypothetical protein